MQDLWKDAAFRRGFAWLFFPSILTLCLILSVTVGLVVRDERLALMERERSRVQVAADRLEDRVQALVTDLLVLAQAPSTRRFSQSPSQAERSRMMDLYSTISREKQVYDQVRFLGADGMELVRINLVNGRPVSVPDAELQNKKDRYYFKETMQLGPRQIYLSPLDLNIEHGVVEMPHKPMLRLGTPVVDDAGIKRGMVILNFLGSQLLHDFRATMQESPSPMLLNESGYWLYGPSREVEWAFMFGRTDSFAESFPDAWQKLRNGGTGVLETSDGIFVFADVHPAHLSVAQAIHAGGKDRSANPAHAESYVWYVVSFIPSGQAPSLAPHRHPLALSVLFAGGILLALLAFRLADILASRSRMQTAVAMREKQLREITDALGVGVLVLDRFGHLSYCNPEAERLLGWQSDELIHTNAHRSFHESTVPEGKADGTENPAPEPGKCFTDPCQILQALNERIPYRSDDEVFYRKDRSRISVEVSCHPLTSEDGHPGLVVAFQNITERKNAAERIEHLAYYDTLTDLPNRRMLLDRLNAGLRAAVRHERALALLFLDLDYFKQINDTLGHGMGDDLLIEVARRLQNCVRREDLVSRQGGDEFVILLPEVAHPDDAAVVARKIIEEVQRPVLLGEQKEHSVTISTSIGISIFPIHGTDDATELMKKADIAMYAAKGSGRNCYHYYDYETSSFPVRPANAPSITDTPLTD